MEQREQQATEKTNFNDSRLPVALDLTEKIAQTKTISSENLSAKFSPAAGGALVSLTFNTGSRTLVLTPEWGYDPMNAMSVFAAPSYVCAPYPNRIENSTFDFNGETIAITDNDFEHALHGHTPMRSWRTSDQSAGAITMIFDSREHADISYPFPFLAVQEHKIENSTLSSAVVLKNIGFSAMPAGLCFHPYFRRQIDPQQSLEEPLVQFNVGGAYPSFSSELPLPIGPPENLSGELNFSTGKSIQPGLDHCFSDWDGELSVVWPESNIRLTMIASQKTTSLGEVSNPSHLVVYSTPEKFALEPQTMMINGFNKLNQLGFENHGVQILDPGELLELSFKLELS